MTPDEHARAAAALLRAEETGIQIGLLSLAHPGMTMDDAYAIQNEILSARITRGRQIAGWKIGLTSKAMQDALNIDVPDSGILFDDMGFANGSEVPAGRFIQPRIEAEIAFIMRNAISGQDVTREDVVAATECVAPALEILDTRILRTDPASGRARIITDTISDNAANAGFVLGRERHRVEEHDLRWVPAIVFKDGEVEETGLGAGVLNDPVESVCWLARRMACYDQRIEAGQVILSGSFIRPLECPPGTRIHADYGAFGTVDIAFA